MKRLALTALATMALAAMILPNARAETKIDPDADRIFKDSCTYLAAAKSFSVNAEVWTDITLPSGVKVQTTKALEIQERRSGELHVEVRSPRLNQGFWLSNKQLTMLDRNANVYGVMDAAETIDKAIDAVEDQFGVELPIGDLLVADPYQNMMENMNAGVSLGKVTVLGVRCHHLLFTGPAADCQVWIADGPRPLPQKIVINLKGSAGNQQITQIFSNWDLVTPIADSAFAFTAPEGAAKIAVQPRQAAAAPATQPASKS